MQKSQPIRRKSRKTKRPINSGKKRGARSQGRTQRKLDQSEKREGTEKERKQLEMARSQAKQLAEELIAKASAESRLVLAGIGLDEVPEGVRAMTGLILLDLSDNRLTELPAWLGELTLLEELNVRSNLLRALPRTVGNLQRLRFLWLENNVLQSLTPALRLVESLERLALSDNPDLDVPESLLKAEIPSEILRYYYETRGDKGGPLLELKLLLVGRGGAGKTTLVKRLSGEQPDMREAETHSIAIRDLHFHCRSGNVRARAWDFGGQEILHATHQFFLTERSLYLLVLEPRSGLAQRDAEYWLKLIEAQGGGSPVIVAMNWSHDRPWRVDEVKLRRKFPFIEAFLSTDALLGDGIEPLHETILEVVGEMQDVWLPFPNRWRDIKDAVAGMRENFLTYAQYSKLCDDYDETDPEAQADLANILHRLGFALHFGNDPRLHDTRVLNPTWATGGVYSVIRSPSVAQKDGQLSVKDMPLVLHEAEVSNAIKASDYPADTHRFILELMRLFQLCYASEEEDGRPVRYLVPELLPEFEPEMRESWEKAPVRLRYRYDVLPPGLLPRFIVRTHALSEGAPHWRHGMVLRHVGAVALVRQETDGPEVYVFVFGEQNEARRVLVGVVRRELELLHRELKVEPVEELALSGHAEQWVSVKALREIEQPKAPRQRLVVQPEGTAKVDVLTELDKLLPASARPGKGYIGEHIPVRLFVSYAHDDERQLKRLDVMLDVLEQYHELDSWRDKRLIAGQEWDAEIRRRLEEADIFVFVASAAALVRPYIRNIELQRAKERHASGRLKVLTVKLEPCAVDEDPYLGQLQRLASNFKSVAEAPLRSAAWEQARIDLLPVIHEVRRQKRDYSQSLLACLQ